MSGPVDGHPFASDSAGRSGRWQTLPNAHGVRVRIGAPRPGTASFAVSGEIDAVEADALLDAITELFRTTGSTVVLLDLSAVTFLGSRGLTFIVLAHREASGSGIELRGVTGTANRSISRVLQITRISDVLAWFATPEAAVRAHREPV